METPPDNAPDAPNKAYRLPRGLLIAAAFAFVASLVLLGKNVLGIEAVALQNWLLGIAGSPWALPVTIGLFVIAAFFGVPQWALIGGAVFAFGPLLGSVYSWISSMISAGVDFWLGRALGRDWVEKRAGARINRFIATIRKNGLLTSFMVRLVPTGPFIFVNMASGVSGMKFRAFMLGTGLGVLPKILAIAFLGQSLYGAIAGNGLAIGMGLGGFVILVIAGSVLARSHIAKRTKRDAGLNPEEKE